MKLHCQIHSSGYLEEFYQPPIIFLHGMALNGSVFKKVSPIIAKNTKRKVYVPDVRNHGKSPWAKEMDYDVLTNDLLELMQQNNTQKAILIGSSMGGRIVMNFALKYPHKADAVVVEDMTPRNIVSSGTNFVQFLHSYIQDILNSLPPDIDLNEAKRHVTELIIQILPISEDKEKFMAIYDPDILPFVKEGSNIRFECNVDVVESMLENDALVQNLPDQNITFDGDALFLYGSKGFFDLDKDPSIKKLFPRAVIKRIEGASHLTHLDSSEEYIKIVTDFILNRNRSQSKY